jgi:DNA-binding phage protein
VVVIKALNIETFSKLKNTGKIIGGAIMARTVSYQDYLIRSLKDPIEAAAYLQAILAVKNPEGQLLKSTLDDVIEAQGEIHNLSNNIQENYEKLKRLLSQTGGEEVYTLAALLDGLGLQLTVTVKAEINTEKTV